MNNREKIQKEALEASLKHKRSGLNISMGVGKTRIAIKHLQKNYNPFASFLVVIPKLAVKESWHSELDKMNLSNFQGAKLEGADLRGIRGRYAIWRKANWWDAKMDDGLRAALTKKWPKEQ